MKRTSIYIIVIIIIVLGAVLFSKCGGADSRTTVKSSADSTSPMGPAPDNNSANNPSLADTGYEKNKTRPITDTLKQKK